MKTVFLFLVRAYQMWLGPILGGTCRFYPSCSHYAYEAVERHGAARGAWLALQRLLRCHPFSPGGIDPVPDLLDDSSDLRGTARARETAQ